jgi:hypothetical protein
MGAVIAGIILFALGLGGPRERLTVERVRAAGYGLSGDELIQLTASPGTELMVGGGTAKALHVQSQAEAPPSAGLFLTLPPVAETAFGGQDITVTWRLRREAGVGEVRLGYFTIEDGASGWKNVTVGPDWRDVTLDYTPAMPSAEGFDYAGIWPGTDAPDGMPIEIESVRVRIKN